MRFPIFDRYLGKLQIDAQAQPPRVLSAPTDAWAIRVVWAKDPEALPRIAHWLDEVASAVETIRLTAGVEVAAEALVSCSKGLLIVAPPGKLAPEDVLVSSAHALALEVELEIELLRP